MEKVIAVSVGLAAIIWAFWPGVAFYPRALGIGGDKPIPKWFGRLWFVVLGLGFIYMGVGANEKISKMVGAIFAIALGSAVIYGGVTSSQRPTATDPNGEAGRTIWRRKILSVTVGILFLCIAWILLAGR
jgi:hypothetical protein